MSPCWTSALTGDFDINGEMLLFIKIRRASQPEEWGRLEAGFRDGPSVLKPVVGTAWLSAPAIHPGFFFALVSSTADPNEDQLSITAASCPRCNVMPLDMKRRAGY